MTFIRVFYLSDYWNYEFPQSLENYRYIKATEWNNVETETDFCKLSISYGFSILRDFCIALKTELLRIMFGRDIVKYHLPNVITS